MSFLTQIISSSRIILLLTVSKFESFIVVGSLDGFNNGQERRRLAITECLGVTPLRVVQRHAITVLIRLGWGGFLALVA